MPRCFTTVHQTFIQASFVPFPRRHCLFTFTALLQFLSPEGAFSQCSPQTHCKSLRQSKDHFNIEHNINGTLYAVYRMSDMGTDGDVLVGNCIVSGGKSDGGSDENPQQQRWQQQEKKSAPRRSEAQEEKRRTTRKQSCHSAYLQTTERSQGLV